MSAFDKQVSPADGKLDADPSSAAEKWPEFPRLGWPPRLWPALVLVLVYWLGWTAVTLLKEPLGVNGFMQFMYYFWAPMIVAALMLVWALFLSRLAWLDRLWLVGCVAAGGIAAIFLVDRTMQFGLIMYGLPVAMTATVVWLVVMRGSAGWLMRLGLVAASVLTWGYYTLVRIDGIDGDLATKRSWRWEETAEQRYLAELTPVAHRPSAASAGGDKAANSTGSNGAAQSVIQADALAVSAGDWPEFRGPLRDSAVHGATIADDWKTQKPREL